MIPHVLAIGDRVKYVRDIDDGSRYGFDKDKLSPYIGREGVITESILHVGGIVEYAFNGITWFDRHCFEFVAAADAKSVVEAATFVYERGGDDDELL